MKYPNIYSLFVDRVKQSREADKPHNLFYFRACDRWEGISWNRFNQEAHEFATARVIVTGIREDKPVVTLETVCLNQDNEPVITGEAVVLLD